MQRAAASQKRLNEFLKTETEIKSGKMIKKEIKGKIVFDSVSFTYPDSGIKALENISFQILPGESVAVIGTTGSGKSTIANLICRMYDPTDGNIIVDDVILKDYDLSFYRSQLGYVPQDVFLFSDTIYNNISFGSTNLVAEDVIQAAREADLYQNIQEFQDGLNTKIGERGITLSGGQKQRVSIARAITRKPKILILDDALATAISGGGITIFPGVKVLEVKLAFPFLPSIQSPSVRPGSSPKASLLDQPHLTTASSTALAPTTSMPCLAPLSNQSLSRV